jgi:hypothetical protein
MIHWNNGLQRLSTSSKSFFFWTCFQTPRGVTHKQPSMPNQKNKIACKVFYLGRIDFFKRPCSKVVSLISFAQLGRTIASYSSYWQDCETFHYKKTWEKCECFWFKFHVLFQSSSNTERNLMRNQTYFPHQSHTFPLSSTHSYIHVSTPTPIPSVFVCWHLCFYIHSL